MKKLLGLILLSVVAFAGNSSEAVAQTRLVINADLTWVASSLTLNGSSQQLLAATASGSAARKGFILVNPGGNATVYVNISGATATTNDIPLTGGSYIQITGQVGPLNAVTVIGTNAQIITLYTGN